MQIQIRDSGEFHRLLQALVDELIDAQIYFQLYRDISAAKTEYAVEFRESWTFWYLTRSALEDAAVHRLCKAYDQYGSGNPSVNLRNLLDTIEANLHLFDEPNFRDRLKGNPFVDSLAATPRRPDQMQLQQDIRSVSDTDPLVKKLVIWRNNFYSHRSPAHALDPEAFAKQYPLTIPDIEALLANGVAIINRYSDLFIATHHSSNIVGRDDYKWLLKAARETLQAREARIEEEIKKSIP